MMTPEERMESGKLYDCTDERLQAQQRALNELVYDYNMTRPSQQEQRQELLRKIFADMGEGCYIEPPLPGAAGDRRSRPGILLPGVPH